MQFVNTTQKSVYTKFTGNLGPGAVSSRKNAICQQFEKSIEAVVDACGDKLGIRLSPREAELLNLLMNLDERGGGFDPATIPEDIRNDPTGAKRAEEAARAAQQKQIDDAKAANAAGAAEEAEINGETDERKPVGPATMKGEKVTPDMLKSGFERIMEENARIAAGEKTSSKEMLDPIGAHLEAKAQEPKEETPAADAKAPGKDPEPVKKAGEDEDDATKTADAEEPIPQAPEKGSAMDRQAADVAQKLSTIGPVDTPAPREKASKGKSKGKGRPKSK